ncbi:MAG: hypothetical protein QOI04_566 [Verrucomicrobiota bacterium]|jgi:hypothetical protein
MKNRLITLSIALIAAAAARGTTVIPPSFDQLVDQAEVIFQGGVTGVRSQWVGEGAQRHIVSYVTFRIEDTLKGEAGSSYTMQMLGGTVDGETMEVTDCPKFQVGDRDILFVEHNGSQFVPLVGIMNGRFRLQHDEASGNEVVVTGEGHPVANVSQLGKDEEAISIGQVLSTDQFKSEIRSRMKPKAEQ